MTTAKSSRATRTKASPRKVGSRATKSTGARGSSEKASETTASSPPAKNPPPPISPEEDPIPEGVKKLVDLFQGPLQSVSFPDVDREVLEERCDGLRDADMDVRRLFLELEVAQERLNTEREALEKCAERGLAYAKVFAVGNEELDAKLGDITLGGKKSARKQKARVPKAQKQVAPPPAPSEEAKVDSSEMSADDLVETEFVIDEDSKISA